jgi:hypothetical protein
MPQIVDPKSRPTNLPDGSRPTNSPLPVRPLSGPPIGAWNSQSPSPIPSLHLSMIGTNSSTRDRPGAVILQGVLEQGPLCHHST